MSPAGSRGILRLASPLLYTSTSFYDVEVSAVDFGEPHLNSTTTVRVNVLDPVGGVPVFDQNIYRISIPDDTPVNSTVILLSAGLGPFDYSISGRCADFLITGKQASLLNRIHLYLGDERKQQLCIAICRWKLR